MPQTNTSKKATNSYHHGDLYAVLVTTARSMVERDGPAGVSLRGVAQAAGVSRAAPYHHFKDKQALLAAVAAQGFEELAENMISKLNDAATPRARLDQLGYGYIEYGVLHPKLFQLMQGPAFQEAGINPKLDDARALSAAPLLRTVAECLPGASEGQIKSGCAAAWSLVHGTTMLSSDGRLQTLIDTSDLKQAALSITKQLQLQEIT